MGKPDRTKLGIGLRATCTAILTLLLVACNQSGPVKIKQILDHPRQYDGREVTIEGQVETSTNVLVFKYFVLRDDTGAIAVITYKAVPARGERIRVRGHVNQAFALQGKSLTVIMEDAND